MSSADSRLWLSSLTLTMLWHAALLSGAISVTSAKCTGPAICGLTLDRRLGKAVAGHVHDVGLPAVPADGARGGELDGGAVVLLEQADEAAHAGAEYDYGCGWHGGQGNTECTLRRCVGWQAHE